MSVQLPVVWVTPGSVARPPVESLAIGETDTGRPSIQRRRSDRLISQVLFNGVFQVQGFGRCRLPNPVRDKDQLLAGLVPLNSHTRRIIVLDANVDTDKERLTVGCARMM